MYKPCCLRRPADIGCLTICLLFLCFGGVPRMVQGEIISHNGTVSSTPPGTGEVNVNVTDLGSTSTSLAASEGFFDIAITDPTREHRLSIAGES